MFLILASIVVFNLVVMFKLSFSDSCIDGWQEFNGSCYLFNKESRGYAMADAQMFCQKFGGDLVIITSEAENSFILQQITSTNRRIFWIGLNDIKEEGKFEWIDGSQLNFTNWDDKEPNDLLEEDCAAIYFGGKWNDFNCNREASLICETKLGLLPQVTNSPTLLNDTDESPICEPGWITWGKSCYDINTRIYASAEKAQSDCEENLSNLLVIDSKEEQIFLTTKLANKTQNFWIGLFKNHTSFIWYGGKILNETLSNWNVNEPAECKNCNCVLMTKGFWSTYACDLPTSYICEKVSVDPKVITLFNAELEIAEGSRNTYTFIGFGVPKPVSILLFGEKAISLTSSSSIGNNSYKYVYQIGPLDVSDCGRTFVHKLVGKFSTVTQNTTAVVLPKVKTLEVFLLNETVIVSWEAILKDHCTLAHNVEWLDVNHTVVHEVCIKNGSTASFSSLKNETDILGVRVYLTSSCTQHQRLSFVEGQERENITVIFAEQKSDAITEIMVDLKPTSLPFGNTKHMKMCHEIQKRS